MRAWIAMASLSLGLLGACGEIDEEFDCAEICDEFNDCLIGFDVDESSCRDSCEDNNTNAEVDACEECVDREPNACTDCTVVCNGVFVPAED